MLWLPINLSGSIVAFYKSARDGLQINCFACSSTVKMTSFSTVIPVLFLVFAHCYAGTGG